MKVKIRKCSCCIFFFFAKLHLFTLQSSLTKLITKIHRRYAYLYPFVSAYKYTKNSTCPVSLFYAEQSKYPFCARKKLKIRNLWHFSIVESLLCIALKIKGIKDFWFVYRNRGIDFHIMFIGILFT